MVVVVVGLGNFCHVRHTWSEAGAINHQQSSWRLGIWEKSAVFRVACDGYLTFKIEVGFPYCLIW